MQAYLSIASLAILLFSCGRHTIPDAPVAAKPQTFGSPLSFETYLKGLHSYQVNNKGVDTHHFCSEVEEGFMQCIIFDDTASNAHVIGIEYIISAEKFSKLPEKQQRDWHAHQRSIHSDTMEAVEIDPQKRNEAVETYGKSCYTWPSADGTTIPVENNR